MAQWVKDPALLLQWSGLLLWHRFNPWPRETSTCHRHGTKKKKRLFCHLSTLLPSDSEDRRYEHLKGMWREWGSKADFSQPLQLPTSECPLINLLKLQKKFC